MADTKGTLALDQQTRVRELLARYVQERHDGRKNAAALALGVAPSFVTEVLLGRRQAGMKLLRGLAFETGQTVDALMSAATTELAMRDAPDHPRRPELGEHPAWRMQRAAAEAAFPHVPAPIWDEMATMSFGAGLPKHLDLGMLLHLAEVLIRAGGLEST